MTNHPHRSKQSWTAVLKIGPGGNMVACHPDSPSELVIRVTDVPVSVSLADVAIKLSKLSWLPLHGPWAAAWERVADAKPYSILKL